MEGAYRYNLFFTGGVTIIVVSGLNENYDCKTPIWYQMLILSMFITVMEYIVGIFF